MRQVARLRGSRCGARSGAPASFTHWCGGPGALGPGQARQRVRNINNLGDGERISKLRGRVFESPRGHQSRHGLTIRRDRPTPGVLRVGCVLPLSRCLLDGVPQALDVMAVSTRDEVAVQVNRRLDSSPSATPTAARCASRTRSSPPTRAVSDTLFGALRLASDAARCSMVRIRSPLAVPAMKA
jgi:hypothetical protein